MNEEIERVYTAALEAVRGGEPAAMATIIAVQGAAPRQAAKMLVYAGGRTVGTVGGGAMEARVIAAAQAAIAEGTSRELAYDPAEDWSDDARDKADICGGDRLRIWIEVLPLRPTLLIIGGGHVGQAVAELGAFLGYRIVVLDDRPELVTAERFPQAHERLIGELSQQVAAFPLTERTFVVLVTPHHTPDETVLAVLAQAQADGRSVAYVGLMGGQRRTAHTFERARAAGVPEALLQRVHTPVGLEIGAETPREIAVSILAEVIAVQRGRGGRGGWQIERRTE